MKIKIIQTAKKTRTTEQKKVIIEGIENCCKCDCFATLSFLIEKFPKIRKMFVASNFYVTNVTVCDIIKTI